MTIMIAPPGVLREGGKAGFTARGNLDAALHAYRDGLTICEKLAAQDRAIERESKTGHEHDERKDEP